MSFATRALLFLSLIPYVSVIEFPMDTSPYSVIFLMLVAFPVFVFQEKIKRASSIDLLVAFVLLAFVAILSIRLVFYSNLDSFRVLGNYVSFFLFFLFFAAISRSDQKTTNLFLEALPKLLLIASFLYLGGSLLQLTSRLTGIEIFSNITKAILSREGRTSFNRGFNSLTAEPSYAGIICSLLACITLYVYQNGYMTKRTCKTTVGNCLAVALLSASATATPFLVIAGIYAAKALRIKVHSIAIFSLVIIVPATIYALQNLNELRFVSLINSSLNSDGGGVTDDVSAISRFASIVNYSIPLLSGDGIFGNALTNVDDTYFINIIRNLGLSSDLSSALEIGVVSEGGGLRTKSAISQSLFLFGIFSLFFWSILWKDLVQNTRKNPGATALPLIIFIGYLIQIPFGHPTFCLAIGIILITRKKHTASITPDRQPATKKSYSIV